MSDKTTLDITGNLGKDARLNNGDFGLVAGFSLGHTPRKKDRATDQWVDAGPTLWVDVSAWGELADKYGNELVKGARVRVIGTVGTREFDGKVYTTVRADMLTVIPKKDGATYRAPAPASNDPWASAPEPTEDGPAW